MNDLFLTVLIGFATGWGLLRLILLLSNRNRFDGHRGEFHHQAGESVPRLGGVALVGGFLAVFLLCPWLAPDDGSTRAASLPILAPALAMFLVGFWDDLRGLGARKKLILQVVVAQVAWFGGLQITGFKNPFTGDFIALGPWGLGFTVLWLVAMTNLINLIDGIDGLAGGIGLMVMALLAYLGMGGNFVDSLLAAGVAGSLIAFLRFNFPPARIYLGDGGAYFLGFLIGMLSIANAHKGTVAAALLAPLIALGLPIIDTALAILRRGLKGLPVFRADRRHIHHRLLQCGFSRRDTVLVLYCISLVLALSAFGLLWTEGRWLPVMTGLGFLFLLLLFRGSKLGLDLLSVGHAVGNSAQMRNRVRYALALGTCLEMEAEQGGSLDELWQEFCRLARKLGFSRVKLVLPHGHRTWESPDAPCAQPQTDHIYEFNPGVRMLVQFQADADRIPSMELEQLSDLAAESWLKAVNRWRKSTRAAVQLEPGTAPHLLEAAFACAPGLDGSGSRSIVPARWGVSEAGVTLKRISAAKRAHTPYPDHIFRHS